MDEKQTPKKQQKKLKRSTSTMKKRKPFFEKNTNTNTKDYVLDTPELPKPQL
jgi:hypothetical protein